MSTMIYKVLSSESRDELSSLRLERKRADACSGIRDASFRVGVDVDHEAC